MTNQWQCDHGRWPEATDHEVRIDPGQDPTAGHFSGLIVVAVLLKSGSLSDPVPFNNHALITDHCTGIDYWQLPECLLC